MGLWEISVILYLSTTVFAIIMTRREQLQTGQTSFVCKAIGFGVCTIWPLAMVGLLAARGLRLA